MKPPSSELAELHAWVADEAGALVSRLVEARSRDAVRELEAARKAFVAAARSIESALTAPTCADAEIRTFMEQCSARAELDAIQVRAKERVAANERLNTALASMQADLDAARADLKAERDRADNAQADVARLTAEFECSLDELRQEHATVIGQQALTCTSLPLDQLLTVFNSLRRATTFSEVLTSLVEGIAREFSRVALFEVRGSRLEGAQQRGFDFERDMSKVVVPLSVDSLLARAVSSGRLESFFADLHEPGTSLPFGGTPACVLAIPIVVQGSAVAVIYADDSDKPEFATAAPRARAKFAELLQQHALLELLRISVEQKTLAELREYAATLVNEIEHAHTGVADTGRNPLERQRRLRDDLDRARRIYAQRTAREGPAAAFFEEHLAQILKARGETIFGRDLAAILGSMNPASQTRVVTMSR